jgi:hypothetical protein
MNIMSQEPTNDNPTASPSTATADDYPVREILEVGRRWGDRVDQRIHEHVDALRAELHRYVERSLYTHEQVHHPSIGPDGQLSQQSTIALLAIMDQKIDQRLMVRSVPRTPDDLPVRLIVEVSNAAGEVMEELLQEHRDHDHHERLTAEATDAAVGSIIDAKISQHVTDDHIYGAIGELVDTAVALRFEEYARFLIHTTTAERIRQVAAQLDDAIDNEIAASAAEGEAAG